MPLPWSAMQVLFSPFRKVVFRAILQDLKTEKVLRCCIGPPFSSPLTRDRGLQRTSPFTTL
jgi:hypothetical protein